SLDLVLGVAVLHVRLDQSAQRAKGVVGADRLPDLVAVLDPTAADPEGDVARSRQAVRRLHPAIDGHLSGGVFISVAGPNLRSGFGIFLTIFGNHLLKGAQVS